MSLCKLCKNHQADDTGSHIVPHFLLKRIFNVKNAKGRDQEISFNISAADITMSFGRSVQPEKLEEVFGELSDEELEARAMAELVVDHEWCKTCEKKFADLETFYAKTLNTAKESEYQSSTDPLTSLLFWLSILWRCSVTQKTVLKLSVKDEKTIHHLLNEFEPGKNNVEFSKKWRATLDQVSYQIYRSPDYHTKIDDDHGTFLLLAKTRQPYAMMVDEFTLLVYMKTSHTKLNLSSFFGFEKLKGPFNKDTAGEFVTPLSTEAYASHIAQVVAFFKDLKLARYVSTLDKLYRKIGHKGNMPEHIVNEVITMMTSDEKKLGRKYTHEEFLKCATAVVLKHHVELRQIRNTK